MSKPPPLPTEVLTRVVRIAGIDGWVLVVLAGGFGVLSAFGSDWLGTIVGGLAAGAGLVELHGRKRLKQGDVAGIHWLVRSQLLLLTIILGYVVYQYFRYNPQTILEMLAKFDRELADAMQTQGMDPVSLPQMLGMSQKQFVAFAQSAIHRIYLLVGASSMLMQGGLAYYYHRKGPIVAQSLRKS